MRDSIEIPTTNLEFIRSCRARKRCRQVIVTTTNNRKLQHGRFRQPYCRFRLSVIVMAWGTASTSQWSKPKIFPWNSGDAGHTLRRYKYFRFWRPYSYFWMSIVVAVTRLHFYYRAMHVVLAQCCYRKSSVRPPVCL